MSWRMFGQIALLVLLYVAASYVSFRIRDDQLTRQYEEQRKAISAAATPAAVPDDLLAADALPDEPRYDEPPDANDPKAEISDGVLFRRDARYRPGSAEDRAQAARKNWAGD